MGHFIYVATNKVGSSVSGTIESADKATVIKTLIEQGLKPISIHEGSDVKHNFSFSDLIGARSVKSDHLVMFTRQLSAMVSAGVPILRSLGSLQEHTESKQLSAILGSVIKDVEGGAALADALGKFPNAFGDVYVNMVRAGEAAGILDDILKRLAIQQEKNASMRKKIKSAMSYPIVLMTITIGAFFGLMIFVIPQIGKIVKDLSEGKGDLPMLTKAMLAISDFMIAYWYILLPMLIGGTIFLLRYIKTPVGKKQFHRLMLKTPAVKVIISKIAVARFARTFSALMGAGVPILESLEVTSRAVGNSVYEEALQQAAIEVKGGKNLSVVIGANPLFPPIVAQMLTVGEETGQTDTILVKVADFYEEEVDAAIDGISSIIEPVMILIMGSMVGLVAASVMGPIASMSQNIQQ